MQDRFQTLFLGPPVLCPTPLCPEVQEPKPPPWPQEGFRGEAPYRVPLQPDSLARMELTGKNTLEGPRAESDCGKGVKRKEMCCSGEGLGIPFPRNKASEWQSPWISALGPEWDFPDPHPTMFPSLSTPFNLTSPDLRTAPRAHASPKCKTDSVQPGSSRL